MNLGLTNDISMLAKILYQEYLQPNCGLLMHNGAQFFLGSALSCHSSTCMADILPEDTNESRLRAGNQVSEPGLTPVALAL